MAFTTQQGRSMSAQTMSHHTVSHPPVERSLRRAGLRARLAQGAAFTRTEHGIVYAGLSAVAPHIVDDNYLQPQPGTSAGDHLTSGLVPIASLLGAAAVYPRLRAGFRAATAMTLGALGVAVGVPGAYYLVNGGFSGDDYTGLLDRSRHRSPPGRSRQVPALDCSLPFHAADLDPARS